jgi:hypothetical protein
VPLAGNKRSTATGISSFAAAPGPHPCVRGSETGTLSGGTSTSLKPSLGDSPRLTVRYDGHGIDRSMRARHGISIGARRCSAPVAFPVPGRVAARVLTRCASLDRLAGITEHQRGAPPNYLSQHNIFSRES